MEYSQVILELLERIKVLENKVKALEEQTALPAKRGGGEQLGQVSRKYRKLAEYLLESGEMRLSLSYAQIEEILGFSLPKTARKFKPSFWANTKGHSFASSWLEVGYKTQVDPAQDRVTFIKDLG